MAHKLTYLSAEHDNAGSSFTFRVHDGITFSLNSATMTVGIDPVNDAPEATNPTLTVTPENRRFVTTLTGSDVEGDDFSFALTNTLPNDNALFSIDPDGTSLGFNVTPDFELPPADFDGDGIYTVEVSVTDVHGDSTVRLLSVRLADMNEGVTASNDFITVDEGDSHSYWVLGNDVDPENNIVSVTLDTLPTWGTASFAGGTLTYVHGGDEEHTDFLTYTIVDDAGFSDTATVFIGIDPVDDVTIANDDLVVDLNSVVDIELEKLLSNDDDPDSDVDDMDLIITKYSPEGTVKIVDGTLTFEPNSNFDGQAELEYVVDVDGTISNTATITIIATVPTPPDTTDPVEEESDPDEETNDDPTTPEDESDTSGPSTTDEDDSPVTGISNDDDDDDFGIFGVPEERVAIEFEDLGTGYKHDFTGRSYVYSSRFDELSIDELVSAVSTSKIAQLSEFDAVISQAFLWEDLDSAKRDFMVNQIQIGVPAIAASAASFLTVGYLAWIIRGGVLLTTFMSSIPAWSSFDIQSVLEAANGDESIEQMVDQ